MQLLQLVRVESMCLFYIRNVEADEHSLSLDELVIYFDNVLFCSPPAFQCICECHKCLPSPAAPEH